MSDGCTDAVRGYHSKPSAKEKKTKYHKDWNGPGWYDYWRKGRYERSCYYGEELFGSYDIYKKFTPPPCPKPELPDGLYYVQLNDGACITMARQDGMWHYHGEQSVPCNDATKVKHVLGRVPVEPIE